MREETEKSNKINLAVLKKQNLIAKTIGLIGKKAPAAILLNTRFGIHTFGLRFPIDVLVLDKNNTVQKIKKNLKPNRIFFWNPRFYIVIELPHGTIAEKGIRVGNQINIV